MGSVLNNIKCPNCDSKDFYYRSHEFYVNCQDCGYSYSFEWKRDCNGKLIKLDETKGYEFDNLISVESKLEKPFCSYTIEYINGVFSCGGFETENDFKIGLIKFNEIIDKSGIKQFSISRLIDRSIVKEIIYAAPGIINE